MSWRPDDWKNPHPNKLILSEGEYGYEVANLLEPHIAFEAGADAMLEARDKELRDKLQVYFYKSGIEDYPYDCYLLTPKELDEILK